MEALPVEITRRLCPWLPTSGVVALSSTSHGAAPSQAYGWSEHECVGLALVPVPREVSLAASRQSFPPTVIRARAAPGQLARGVASGRCMWCDGRRGDGNGEDEGDEDEGEEEEEKKPRGRGAKAKQVHVHLSLIHI